MRVSPKFPHGGVNEHLERARLQHRFSRWVLNASTQVEREDIRGFKGFFFERS